MFLVTQVLTTFALFPTFVSARVRYNMVVIQSHAGAAYHVSGPEINVLHYGTITTGMIRLNGRPVQYTLIDRSVFRGLN